MRIYELFTNVSRCFTATMPGSRVWMPERELTTRLSRDKVHMSTRSSLRAFTSLFWWSRIVSWTATRDHDSRSPKRAFADQRSVRCQWISELRTDGTPNEKYVRQFFWEKAAHFFCKNAKEKAFQASPRQIQAKRKTHGKIFARGINHNCVRDGQGKSSPRWYETQEQVWYCY